MIDSHIHFWHYQAEEFPWIGNDMSVLKQDFLPEHLNSTVADTIDAMVAIQARCSWDENHYLINLAKQEPRLQAVIGWFDFNGHIEEQLNISQDLLLLKGFRHLIQDEKNPSSYLLNHQGLNFAIPHLQAASKVYEVLIHQADLAAAIKFCQRHDAYHVVIDHLAKPRFGAKADFVDWEAHIKKLAELEHVSIKISGLETEAGAGSHAADFQVHVDVLHQSFGADRLLWGSNWPVCKLTHSYAEILNNLQQLTQYWSESERLAFTEGTATRIYQLNTNMLEQRKHNGFEIAK